MATLTIENGYVKYVAEGHTEWIPLTLLAQCRLIEYPLYVAIIFPQGDVTHSSNPELKIYPPDGLASVSLVLASLQSAQLSGVSSDNGTYAKEVVVVAGYIYEGIAKVGSSPASAVWRVKRTSDATPFITTWADSGNFTQVMNNYATLTYA